MQLPNYSNFSIYWANSIKKWIPVYHFFASLKLTIFLLSFGFLLIFFGTLDQVHFGIHEVQKRYFQSFFVFWSYPHTWPKSDLFLPWLRIPLLGGYLLGGLLLINLVAAHVRYFTFKLRKIGIFFVHSGLILLIISGFLSSALQEESQMWLYPGQLINYAENFYDNEIVIVDTTDSAQDIVWSIPVKALEKSTVFEIPSFPFRLKVEAFFPNANIVSLDASTPCIATQGVGKRMHLGIQPQPIIYTETQANIATAYISVVANDYQETWLVSNVIDDRFPKQFFDYQGRHYTVSLRFRRIYFPFSFELLDFKHEKYPGTDIPKDFSSKVRIQKQSTQETMESLIYMNHPLRYAGYTFYQASFNQHENASMLQVVKNPSFLLPYIAVIVVSVGLVFQCLVHLIQFLRRKKNNHLCKDSLVL